MITRRTFAALSSTERRLLRSQSYGSGQCARCFHSSRRQQADVQRPEDGAPAIKDSPKRADNNGPLITKKPTKRGRAELISNELSMLQKGPPPGDPTSGPGSAAGTNQADPVKLNAGDGFTATPTSMGGLGQRMGENVSEGREGVNAQGVGRLVDPSEEGKTNVNVARGTKKEGALDQRQVGQLRHRLTEARPLGLPVRPRKTDAKALLLRGRGAGVPLSDHPTATILDRYKLATDPSHDIEKPAPRRQVRMAESDRKEIAGVLIGGRYDGANVLGGEQVYNQALLNEVAKKTIINGTYLGSDQKKLIEKVQSLLPVAMPARAGAAQTPRAAAASAKA